MSGIRANSKKKCFIQVRLPETNQNRPTVDENSPSTLKNYEVSALLKKIQKIPNSMNLPNFMQKLNEKFSSSDLGDCFEDYCNRALLMMEQNFEEEEQQEKNQRKELIRKQKASFDCLSQKTMNF